MGKLAILYVMIVAISLGLAHAAEILEKGFTGPLGVAAILVLVVGSLYCAVSFQAAPND